MTRVEAVLASFSVPATLMGDRQTRSTDTAIIEYVQALQRLGQKLKEEVLVDPSKLLDSLDPRTNSIGYLKVLDIAVANLDHGSSSASSETRRSAVRDAVVHFLLNFDAILIRYVGTWFLRLLERVASGTLLPAPVSVELLTFAMRSIDPEGTVFTSIHLPLAKVAYESQCTDPVVELLDSNIVHFPSTSVSRPAEHLCSPDLPPTAYISTVTGLTHEVTSTEVLEYNYVCGLIHTSRRNWKKASQAFDRVVAHPSKSKGVSKIMVDAYKKLLLVSLLQNQPQNKIAPHAASIVRQACTTLAKPYCNVSTYFAHADPAELIAEVDSNTTTWQEDGNASLIAEVVSAYQQWQIINLRRLYSKVLLSQVQALTSSASTGAPLTEVQDVVSLIQSMLDAGLFSAQLHLGNGEDDYLEFLEEDTLTEEAFARELARSQHNIATIGKDYKLVNDRLNVNRDYVKAVLLEQRRNAKDFPHPGSFEHQIEDEDLMTGIIANG